jgi:hypothetical protein
MSNWSKILGNSHSHLNLKRIAIPNSHTGVNFQNSIPIHESIQFSIQFLVLCVKEQKYLNGLFIHLNYSLKIIVMISLKKR